MKTKYKNGCGPDWMDRYVDPATGKKYKWNYKPSNTVQGAQAQARATLAGIYRVNAQDKLMRRAERAAANDNPTQQQEAA